MFNLEGLQAAALYRVAADVGISAGNLGYHFKSKADVAAGLADRFETEFRRLTSHFTVPLDATSFIHRMQQVLTLLWRYRFFFNAPQYLAGIDEGLARRFHMLRNSLRDLIRQYTRDVIEVRGLRPPRDGGADILADNIVAVWVYWLQMESEASPSDPDQPGAQAIRECLEHHFGLLEPYLGAKFAAQFHQALDELNDGNAVPLA